MSVAIPAVTAVMCTGLPGREQLACAAIKSFCAQTYAAKELLILNDSLDSPTHYALLRSCEIPADVRIREVIRDKIGNLRDCRNAALDLVDTPWVMQWDDDDWSHPTRITRQMALACSPDGPTNACVVLARQLRYSFPRNTAFMHHNKGDGIAGTILHPNDGQRYPTVATGDRKIGDGKTNEDADFLLNCYADQSRRLVLDDPDWAHLYLRFYHRRSVSGEKHVMRVFMDKRRWHNWIMGVKEKGGLSRAGYEYLREVLQTQYGLAERLQGLARVKCQYCSRQCVRVMSTELGELPKPQGWACVWREVIGPEVLGVCTPCRVKHPLPAPAIPDEPALPPTAT